MSKKNKTVQVDANGNPAAAPATKRGGRQPMTEAQKNVRGVDKALKVLATNPEFTNPDCWASLSPEVIAGVEKACVHVRTVIHAAEANALRARLAALEGASAEAASAPAAAPATEG